MKKNYTSDEIMKMAVGVLKAKYDADLDGDGSVTSADARIADRSADGLDADEQQTLMAKARLDSLASYAGAGFDADGGRLYAYYRDIYEDGATRAAKNAFGLASKYTGGYGSTYAASAAAEAYDRYSESLASDLADANDRAFKNSMAFAQKAAEYGDYSYMEALGADMSAQKRSAALAEAIGDAKYGDYSGLEYMGVDTTAMRVNDLLDVAAEMAEYGDYSGLEALGMDVSSLKENGELEKALALAKYGDTSLLGKLAGGNASFRDKIGFSVQKGAEAAYMTGGYYGLVSYLDKQIGYGQITENGKAQILAALTGK